jgi:hypothetical protein
MSGIYLAGKIDTEEPNTLELGAAILSQKNPKKEILIVNPFAVRQSVF